MTYDWMWEGVCRNVDTSHFFRHEYSDRPPVSEQAIEACLSCPVTSQCLEHALKHEDFGIWGATTARERRRMRREQGIKLDRLEIKSIPKKDPDDYQD